jgi:PKD repeat protein
VPFIVWTVNPSKGCQVDSNPSKYQSPNNDEADNIADDLSHELSESITDPLGTGWFNNTGGNEVSDNCQSYGPTADPFAGESPNAYEPTLGGDAAAGTLFDQAINGDRYYTQTNWSNGNVGCQTQASADALTPQFVEAAPGTTASFDPTTSTQSAGSISSVSWNFGDGSTAFSTSAPAPINHTYAVPGTYTVTLTLVDSFGNLATASHPLTTGARPAAAFTGPTSGVVGRAVTFDASGSTYANGPLTYAWSFGDGTTSAAGPATPHTYSAPGTYTVSLTVTAPGGLQSTISHQIAVAGPPTASFTGPSSGLARAPVKFDASGSSDLSGSIVRYSWSFGDGGTSAGGPATSHTYSAKGTYTVTLTVTDSNGLQSTASQQITISTVRLGKPKVSGNTVSVPVTCKGATACSFVLQLTAKKGKKTVVVGKVRVTIAAGKTKTVQVKLNGTGQQLLAKSHSLKTTLAAVSGGKAVSSATLTFNQKR